MGVLAGPDERIPEDLPAVKPAPAPSIAEHSLAVPAPVGVRMTDQGIVRVTVPPDQVIEGRQACAARAAVRSLSDGRRLPVLLVMAGVLGVSMEARRVYVNSEEPCAFALVGESPVDRVIAHYLLRWTAETTPARFFTSEQDAVRWLRQYACED